MVRGDSVFLASLRFPRWEQFISVPSCATLRPPASACGLGESVDYTRFEKARIVGARALQLSMGAPPLIETPADVRNPVRVAMLEYEASAIPLTVKRSATHQVKQ